MSPFELKYHKIEHDQSREIFIDAYECIRAGLTTDELTYTGPHYNYDNVPIALRPLQQPHPPFWYGSSGAGRLDLGGRARPAFRHARAERIRQGQHRHLQGRRSPSAAARPAQPKPEFSGGIAIGVQRHIFVDETDEKAKRWAKPAMEMHLEHINWLRTKHGVTATAVRMRNVRGTTFEECVAEGTVIAGSPKTVLAEIEKQMAQIGVNYLLTYLFLGTMSLADAMRSLAAVQGRSDAEARADVSGATSPLPSPPPRRPASRSSAGC